jgi:hypothetical protein
MLWRHEHPFIAAIPAFAAAETVVDLGAGNGAFGRRLAGAHPEKRFLGVEPNAEVFAAGARLASPPNYRYVLGGWDTVEGVHDLLFARLVVMYLPDRSAFYAWARQHFRTAIVVNNDDAATVSVPPTPVADAAIEEGFHKSGGTMGTTLVGDHDLGAMQAEWAAAGFLPAGSATVLANLSGPDLRLAHHVTLLVVANLNPGALTRPLLDEMYHWSLDPEARSTVGFTYHSVFNPLLADHEVGRASAP